MDISSRFGGGCMQGGENVKYGPPTTEQSYAQSRCLDTLLKSSHQQKNRIYLHDFYQSKKKKKKGCNMNAMNLMIKYY